jgi:hypothetical protein
LRGDVDSQSKAAFRSFCSPEANKSWKQQRKNQGSTPPSEDQELEAMKGWTRSIPLGKIRLVVVPVHVNLVHWITFVIDCHSVPGTVQVTEYDSCGGSEGHPDFAAKLQSWFIKARDKQHRDNCEECRQLQEVAGAAHGSTSTLVPRSSSKTIGVGEVTPVCLLATPLTTGRPKVGVCPSQLPRGNDCGVYTMAVMYDVATWSGTGPCVRNLPPAREAAAARRWITFILLRGGFDEESENIKNARLMIPAWEQEDVKRLSQNATTETRGPEGTPRDSDD